MIKFCGNCGTTVTEKELTDDKAVKSGSYVYCQNCAAKLGFGPKPEDDLLSRQDSKGTKKLAPGEMKLDIPDDIFEDNDGGEMRSDATTPLSLDDLKKHINAQEKKTQPSQKVKTDTKKEVTCPSCSVKLRVSIGAAAKKIKCPKCRKIFEVPGNAPKEEATQNVAALVKAAKAAPKKVPTHERAAPKINEKSATRSASKVVEKSATRSTPKVAQPSPALESHEDPLEPLEPIDNAAGVPIAEVKVVASAKAKGQSGPQKPAGPVTAATSRSRRAAGARSGASGRSSRRKAEKSQTGGGGNSKGLAVLLVILLVGAGAPFILMGLSGLDDQMTTLGGMITQKLAGIGIGSADEESQPVETDPADAPAAAAEDEAPADATAAPVGNTEDAPKDTPPNE